MSTAPTRSTAPAEAASASAQRPTSKSALGSKLRIASWTGQIVIVVVFVQSLFFKFTYAAETQAIFDGIGGRFAATGVGVMELIAAVLLVIPRTIALGALLSLGILGGAIFTHLVLIGIEVVNPETQVGDGGTLFIMAVVLFVVSAAVLRLRRAQLFELAAQMNRR